MRFLVIALVPLVALLAFACSDDEDGEMLTATQVSTPLATSRGVSNGRIFGSGNLVTKAYEFDDFTSVELSPALRAEISFSESYSVLVEVDDNALHLIEVSREGESLRIELASGTSTTDVTLNVTITMPVLSSIDLSGASQATVTGFENMDILKARLSGATTLDGELDVAHLDLRLSGASTASFTGSGIEADLNASGASSLDLADFVLEIARVTVSGASQGTVNVRDELGPVEASGVSHLRYIGQPTLTGVDASSLATIEPAG